MMRTIKRLSKPVQYLWSNFHYLRGFTGWKKRKGSRAVHFETTYIEKRKKKVVVYVDEIIEHKVSVTIPPQSKEPLYDFKLQIGAKTAKHKRDQLKEMLYPKIENFIARNSL